MYVQQASIAETQKVKELLTLLEDESFHVVSHCGLFCSDGTSEAALCT